MENYTDECLFQAMGSIKCILNSLLLLIVIVVITEGHTIRTARDLDSEQLGEETKSPVGESVSDGGESDGDLKSLEKDSELPEEINYENSEDTISRPLFKDVNEPLLKGVTEKDVSVGSPTELTTGKDDPTTAVNGAVNDDSSTGPSPDQAQILSQSVQMPPTVQEMPANSQAPSTVSRQNELQATETTPRNCTSGCTGRSGALIKTGEGTRAINTVTGRSNVVQSAKGDAIILNRGCGDRNSVFANSWNYVLGRGAIIDDRGSCSNGTNEVTGNINMVRGL